MSLKDGDRVLFEEDGDWVLGTVHPHEQSPDGLAIWGDNGGVHYGGVTLGDNDLVIPITDIIYTLGPGRPGRGFDD
jgi:hypothetical protein